MRNFITFILLIAALAGGWLLRGNFGAPSMNHVHAESSDKAAHYQCAMHPWVKSNKPGRCTICGMELTPFSEGAKGVDAPADANVVTLTQNQIQVLHVQTTQAKVQPLLRTLRVAGMIDDDERRHRIISAYVDGRVDKLFANHHGVEVVEGEPLALLYSPTLLQAQREYRQLTGDLKKNTALRLKQMGLTQAQIEALPSKADDELSTEILAPLTGTVVEHGVYEGQYVTMGEKLFEIADFSTMWFQFRAYEQDMPWIKVGQAVDVTTPSLPGKTYTGKITFIDPNFDESTRSTQVRVELANPMVEGRRELLHRLYADGAVKVETLELLTVPRSAVIEAGPEAVAYVDQGTGAYVRTPLKLGRRGDVLMEVLSGLKAGDKVVTNGNLLMDGQAEMNRSFMSPVGPVKMADSLVALSDTQKEAIAGFVKTADALAAALAADDLAAFNQIGDAAMEQSGKLLESLRSREGVSDALDALEKERHLQKYEDIQAARVAFQKFTVAATAVLEPLRMADGAPAFDVWECFMVDEAVPNAAKKGRWVQVAGRTGENPFFGKQMLNCAKEIKRTPAHP